MNDRVVGTAVGTLLMVGVAHLMQVDWQLLLMAVYTASHGQFFAPELLFKPQSSI